MSTPFPGMDPYLEHPVLWEGVHSRLIVAIANQLQPLLDPRYVASIEERVFIEGPQRRIPDVWVQRVPGPESPASQTSAKSADAAIVVEVEELEIHQKRVEILDAYNDMKLVTLLELLSPTNKTAGPGRESYLQKQSETLERDCHLVEIDLLRTGAHAVAIPDWRMREFDPYEYIVCVNRWPNRNRFEIYTRGLREPLPTIHVPLEDPDPDVPLDLQAVLAQVYEEGRYARRIRYHQPCQPPLSNEDQQWASEMWNAFPATEDN